MARFAFTHIFGKQSSTTLLSLFTNSAHLLGILWENNKEILLCSKIKIFVIGGS